MPSKPKRFDGVNPDQQQACRRLFRDWLVGNRAVDGKPSPEQTVSVAAYAAALRAVGRDGGAVLLSVVLLGQTHGQAAKLVGCSPTDVRNAMTRILDRLVRHYARVDQAAAAA